MSDAKPVTIQVKGTDSAFVKERILWAIKPMGLLVLVLWVLHPATSSAVAPLHLVLMGFLAGTAYGLALYGRKLRSYLMLRTASQTQTPNRVPQEYYWGSIAQVMFDNS